jgi:hypothetical protein
MIVFAQSSFGETLSRQAAWSFDVAVSGPA